MKTCGVAMQNGQSTVDGLRVEGPEVEGPAVEGPAVEGPAVEVLHQRRLRRLATYGFVTLGLLGCESRTVLLGRGNADAGSTHGDSTHGGMVSSSPVESTEVTSRTPALGGSSEPALGATGPTSSDVREITDAPTNSETTENTVGLVTVSSSLETATEAPSFDESSTADGCEQVHARCEQDTPGAICQDMLIFCRVALPDGGPPCEDVYSQCVDMGYTEQDCEHATSTCEAGGGAVLSPEVDSTLRAQ